MLGARNRILLVNHGFPPRYNAGSEVYTQTLAVALQKGGAETQVFARHENPYAPDFVTTVERDRLDPSISVTLVNHAREMPYAKFHSPDIDDAFHSVMTSFKPDIVHFGHLNHLSLRLPSIVKELGATSVYTLHDYWLMCPRGQFLHTGLSTGEPWEMCTGQQNDKCAERCFNRFATGTSDREREETQYWTQWVDTRQQEVRKACDDIDLFIAPSRHLRDRFVDEFGLAKSKVRLLPYGFDLQRLEGRARVVETPFVFGYIGRHQPSKGIDQLITAFQNDAPPDARLRIWGRPDGKSTSALLAIAKGDERIEFLPEYQNENIVDEVFNQCDCIVVPSIWEENAPLVIHEALQAKVPVITSNHGGMGELIKDGVNGLTFDHRNVKSLGETIVKASEDPKGLADLGKTGYLYSGNGAVPSMEEHCTAIQSLYQTAQGMSQQSPALSCLPSPWRITFDTNPDDCNFTCTMCEQHSPFSPHQRARKEAKIRRRRMDIDVMREIVAECKPRGLREIIPTTMGEPLMYKHMPEVINLCREFDVKLNLTTNGSFYGRGVDAWARDIVPVTSDVKISWNGADATSNESIMRGSNFEKQVSNLKQFISHRDSVAKSGGNYCSVTLQLTFMEANLDQIVDIIQLAIDNGVDRVKGHHLWAHFDEIKHNDMRRSAESRARWNKVAQACRELVQRSHRKVRLEHFEDIAEDGMVATPTACPFLGKEAWVNHSGRFDPCCAPDAERLSLGAFGNVKDKGLLDIWNSKKYRKVVDKYLDNPLCVSCTMRR